MTQRVFTWDFILDEVKYFQFSVWSISFSCLHEIPRNETHFGCYFIVAILTEMKYHFGSKMLCKYYPEIKSSKTKHLRLQMFHKNKHSRSKNQNKIEFHFISPAVETNVNRIFFMPLASKGPASDYQHIRKWVQNLCKYLSFSIQFKKTLPE